MARIEAREAQQQAAMTAAALMAAAARTAPKTRGLDSLRTLILDGEDLESLAKAMETKHETKRTKVASISLLGRNTQGVTLMGVGEGEQLAGLAVVAPEETSEGDDESAMLDGADADAPSDGQNADAATDNTADDEPAQD